MSNMPWHHPITCSDESEVKVSPAVAIQQSQTPGTKWADGSVGEAGFHFLQSLPILSAEAGKAEGARLSASHRERRSSTALSKNHVPRRQLTLLEGRVFHLVGPISIVCDETLCGGPGGVGNVGLDVVTSDLRQGPRVHREIGGGFTKHICWTIIQVRMPPTGTSLVVQWLRPRAPNARARVWSLVRELDLLWHN